MLLETKPEIVSSHFGLPEIEVIRELKSGGYLYHIELDDGGRSALARTKRDQCHHRARDRSGGHRATFTRVDISMQPGLFSLLPQIVDAVKVPVIAAGGVADGRTAAAAFMLGASAVRIGTAFLHCEEAEVREAHRAALAAADDACTVVTDVISGRPCRYIRNKLVDDLVASGLQPLPLPAQQSLTARLGDAGDREWTALTAGQSAALSTATKAAELVERLADETTQRLRAFA
jgi:nitronate monooxygenase